MNDLVALPVGWILAAIGVLGSVIASLSGIIYSSFSARLAAQEKRLSTQDKIIDRLQADIVRMSKGCGLQGCHWKAR